MSTRRRDRFAMQTLAVVLALLFLDEWPWRKIAVSVIILPMMVPVDAANSFFMLFGDHGPVNELLSWVLHRPIAYAWLADPQWALLPIILAEVWQWTPLMFLLVLTGFLNVPHNQWRAALSLGATPARAFFRIVKKITENARRRSAATPAPDPCWRFWRPLWDQSWNPSLRRFLYRV